MPATFSKFTLLTQSLQKGVLIVCLLLFTLTFYGQARRECSMGSLPSVTYRPRSVTLLVSDKAILDNVGEKLKQHPECNIKVVGYGDESKRGQQESWDRVYNIVKYLSEQVGIATGRIIFVSGESGSSDIVDLVATMETGPYMTTVPVAHLRRSR